MINRRDFLALSALFTGALVTLPYVRIEEQMELSDIWAKLANQARLTPEELDFLKLQGRETQQRNAFIAGNTSPAGTLVQNLPFFPIYSQVLETDVAEVSIEIPGGFNHLLCMGSGRLTPDGSARDIRCKFNDDLASNYIDSWMYQQASSVIADVDAASAGFYVSLFDDGASVNSVGSFVQFIPNYRSPFYKTSIHLYSTSTGASGVIGVEQGVYENTAKVSKITYYPLLGTASIAKGSVFSVYGIL